MRVSSTLIDCEGENIGIHNKYHVLLIRAWIWVSCESELQKTTDLSKPCNWLHSLRPVISLQGLLIHTAPFAKT